ncbi:MAG TPA: ribosome biogenesis GTPase Der [Candidatus Kapabacteria bacterium]|nr:ribosome biogenesis GTPase Der [Candidatus Kapabacteria bacterium]
MALPLVAIVGRPNVGKSTLFNRLVGERRAITESVSGVTRDRHYAKAEWIGRDYQLVDTGGVVPFSDDIFERAIREQAHLAIDEADVILFVVDDSAGIHPLDEEISHILRKSGKQVLLLVNKTDNMTREQLETAEFYGLGLGDPIPVSAISGRGVGDFLDILISHFPPKPEDTGEPEPLKLAIVGKPNVGKSSYLNSLLGVDRAIVTPVAGTTRDAIHSEYTFYGQKLMLIDTAGIRRKKYIKDNLELYSTVRTMKAIEECDVALVLVDATQGLENQDARILNDVLEARKGAVLVVNKWDAMEKDTMTSARFEKEIKEKFKTFAYVPILFISAETKQRHTKPIELALKVHAERNKRIPTGELNGALLEEIEATPPPNVRGHDLRINYITQVRVAPPVFAFFSNHPEEIPESYRRFLENTLRKHYSYDGVPISLIFRKKN